MIGPEGIDDDQEYIRLVASLLPASRAGQHKDHQKNERELHVRASAACWRFAGFRPPPVPEGLAEMSQASGSAGKSDSEAMMRLLPENLEWKWKGPASQTRIEHEPNRGISLKPSYRLQGAEISATSA
jgi:hypothetical protein